MMLLILVQRGKGGGLTGALGGMGGQSAFGSKAGDMFTRITVITAIIWITICMVTIAAYNPPPRPEAKKTSTLTSADTSEEQAAGAAAPDSSGAANADAQSSVPAAGDAPVDKTTDSGDTNAPGKSATGSDDDEPLPGEGNDQGATRRRRAEAIQTQHQARKILM